MPLIGQIIDFVLWIYLVLMFVRLVFDWVQMFARSWSPSGIALVLLEGVYSATDPPIHFFRRIFKPIRIGGIALDLSFLAVILVIYLLIALNGAIWTY
ncbi:MAG: YggT family protein [Nocardioidaceae bacterium]|nr:YggT family protein [Nocardioidaceae bacterium]